MEPSERERLAKLEQRVDDLDDDVRTLHAVIHGPPRDDSVRGRIHKLEEDRVAAKAANAALEAAKMMRSQTVERRFTKREKVLALLFAGTLALCTLVTTILVAVSSAAAH